MMQAERQVKETPGGDSRRRMLALVHILFKEVRPDLRGMSDEERREARLDFCAEALKLKRVPASMSLLTNHQIKKIIEALREMQAQPRLPNSTATPARAGGAEVVHLATAEQVWAINKLLDHLGWRDDSRKKFIRTRYRRDNPVHLAPKQAASLIRVLLNIGAQRQLKEAGFVKVSRQAIRLQVPALKAQLGIDRRPERAEANECQKKLI